MKRTSAHKLFLIAACVAFFSQLLAPVLARSAVVSEQDVRSLLCSEVGALTKAAETAAREVLGAAHRSQDEKDGGSCVLCHAPAAPAFDAPIAALHSVRFVSRDLPLPDETPISRFPVGAPLGLRAPPKA